MHEMILWFYRDCLDHPNLRLLVGEIMLMKIFPIKVQPIVAEINTVRRVAVLDAESAVILARLEGML
jgi:hypothetical protein